MAKRMSDYERRVWQHICDLVGREDVRVVEYWDRDEKNRIAMCLVPDYPIPGVTTYATIGVSRVEVRPRLGVEFIAASASASPEFEDVIGTAAFFVTKDEWRPAPGCVFEDVARVGWPQTTLPHVLFEPPWLYQEQEPSLENLELDERTVTWLMPLPISDEELGVAQVQGVQHLRSLFEAAQIDLFDAARPSVV